MLVELRVRNLGVLDDVSIGMEEGMTAITGETGAGKTLVVEAMGLLCGSRADASMVRHGADEAVVEGRFVDRDEEEVVISRQVGSNGRSRAWVNGRMMPVSALGEFSASLVDIYSQHAHHSLLRSSTQKDILDMSGGVDLSGLMDARRKLRKVEESIGRIESSATPIHREIELIRRQLDELDRASLDSPAEYGLLGEEEERLAGAEHYHEAFSAIGSYLEGDGGESCGVIEMAGAALLAVRGLSGCSTIVSRLEGLQAEAQDLLLDVHGELVDLVFDPARLDEIRARRLALKELMRRYSDDGSLASVIAKREAFRQLLEELGNKSRTLSELEQRRSQCGDEVRHWEALVREERCARASELASRVADELERLGMGNASFVVEVAETGTGEPIEFRIGANPGEPVLPVAKVASGGELARTMLAIRLAIARISDMTAMVAKSCDAVGDGSLDSHKEGNRSTLGGTAPDSGEEGTVEESSSRKLGASAEDRDAGEDGAGNGVRNRKGVPATMVFDEVDAGIGGEAGLSVGRALFELSKGKQVIVVTHLPQVAAFADHQIRVTKTTSHTRTFSKFVEASGQDRVEEIARMLSGQPTLQAAMDHARELLATANNSDVHQMQ
ncbi:MAG: DNA repair protein RecN [Acidimicrobiales bacterium]